MKILLLTLTIAFAVANEDVLQEFTSGNIKFTADVYKENLKSNNGNFLISPFSAETILALALEGSQGETAEEFIRGLNFPDSKEKTSLAIKSVLPQISSKDENLKLLFANKLYVNDGFSVKDEFKQTAKSQYLAEAENIYFGDAFKAASSINDWVENRTNHKIKNLVDPKSLSSDVKVVLLNTLYLMGKWVNAFDHLDTRKEKFYTSADKAVEVDTMHTTDYFNYYDNKDLKAKFLELPYIGGQVSMTIVLPNRKKGLEDLELKLEEVLKPQPYTSERVYVALPRFTIESQVKFVPILKNLGVKKAFISGEADLSGIGGKKGDLFISDVVQKTFINVTETGTEAAAATAGLVALLSAPITPRITADFIADHPFIFYIQHNSGAILFVGRHVEE